MKTRTLKTTGAMAIIVIVMTAQSASAYYNPSTGRWLGRDPIVDLAFVKSLPKTFSRIDLARILKESTMSPFALVNNNPMSSFDSLGLCPCETCDKWEITIDSMYAYGIEAAALGVKAEMRADKSCQMKDDYDYEKDYQYVGLGFGVGLDISVAIGVGGKTFTTPCIHWADHNGFGRVTGEGIGLVYTAGNAWFKTPQTYFNIASPSWGIDASAATSLGYWHIIANSNLPPWEQPHNSDPP